MTNQANNKALIEQILGCSWFAYIGWGRTDLDYVMYKKFDLHSKEKLFLKIDKESGNWQTQAWKRNDMDAIEIGSINELTKLV